MPERGTSGRAVALDHDGCLLDFRDWDEEVAAELAARAGLTGELGPESIAILKFIREHYERYHFFPIVRSICRKLHEPKDCVADTFMSPLIAWKLAGLPHPEEPIISLLAAGQSPG